MHQRSAARSLRRYGLEVPSGFAMGSFPRAVERVSQAVRTAIDRQRCGAAKPRPRRAKPRRRREHCHSTALLAAGNSAAAGRGSSCVLFYLLGRVTGRRGSCNSVLPRRNALYDAPRVIIKHCSRTARQCATSQSSEERRKLVKRSKRQLNRALLAREPKTGLQRCCLAVLNCTCSLCLAERARRTKPVGHRSRGSASIDATSGGELQEDLRDDVEWRSPFQD